MVTTRSQSLRVPQRSYGQLQNTWGEPGLSPAIPEGYQQAPRFQRSLSFRHRREKSRSRGLESSAGPPEGLDLSPHEIPAVGLGDTEQLIQGKNRGSWRIRQYKKVNYALRRTWENFVANLPGVTFSQSTSPSPPLDITR
ncbi:uncharacterized protein C11orf86 homolog isoform X2 [Monodelphis domestica]|uniref:uncharacterized protein C11orf86 homolog isoform X2 n=1 Tax=Monodelphis domestica TaxID=13616 RepID=UPI00044326BE|nr:uncharacterized protein C11orf86 homolog isoform X2 [Monodelphis domestica]